MLMQDNIETLLDAHDWRDISRRLVIFSDKTLRRYQIPESWSSPEDISNDAIEKTYNGVRKWREHEVPLLAHLMGTVRSLANAEAKRYYWFLNWQKANPDGSVQAFEVVEALEKKDHMEKFMTFLMEEYPNLAEFLEQTNTLLKGGCKTDTDVEKALNLCSGQVLRNRNKIKKVRIEWQDIMEQMGKKEGDEI
ncbi:MAG: hypothetical protein ABJP94_23435 [Paracoccaceae bacterium]